MDQIRNRLASRMVHLRGRIANPDHPVLEASSQCVTLVADARFGRIGQVAIFARIVREVVQLVLGAGLAMEYELPEGGADHAHPRDLIVMHVVLTEEGVIPSGRRVTSEEWTEASPPDFEVFRNAESRD